MSTHLVRVLGAATAALLAATAATTAPSATAAPRLQVPDRGLVVGASTLSAPVDDVPAGRTSLRAGWPVGKRTGLVTEHTRPQTGGPSRNLTSVFVVQRRAPSTVGATVVLQAEPTAGTLAWVVVAFGELSPDGGSCRSPAGHNFSFPTRDLRPEVDNPVYDGATITVRPFLLEAARNAAWNCAFAKVVTPDPADESGTEAPTTYDQVTRTSLREYVQKPILSIAVAGRRLEPDRFTEVPIRISNSDRTIATAPDVRLVWETTRVRVRALHEIGTIRPGTGKRRTFSIKRTERGPAQVTFTAISRDYRSSVTLRLRSGSS